MVLKVRRFFSRTKTIAPAMAISFESTLHPPTVLLRAPGAIRGKAYCFKHDLLLIFSMKSLTIKNIYFLHLNVIFIYERVFGFIKKVITVS